MKRDDTLKAISNGTGSSSSCLVDFKLLIPVRFEKVGLLRISETVETLAVMALVVGNKYRVYNMAVRITINPFRTEKVLIDNKDYYVFSFKKGQDFTHREVLRDTDIIKPIVEETLIKGNYPFFINYEDAKILYDGFKNYIGNNIASDDNVVDMFISLNARTKKSSSRHWRHRLPDDELEWIGIGKVGLSRNDGFNRLTGAYLREGLVASSLDEKDRKTEIEKILK
jgi:hypothetical protein